MQTTHHPIPESIQQQVRKLRLSGLLSSLPLRLAEAQNHQLSAAQFLELVLQDELNVRHQRELARRQSAASFRESRALEGFDFSFNSSINRQQVYELASCHFIEEKRDAILVGPPGVGKSHIVQALGREVVRRGYGVLYRSIFDVVRDVLEAHDAAQEGRVIKKYLKPDLLIIDDMGLKAVPERGAEILLEIIMRRYEVRSTMMTSNRPLEEWGKLLGDVPSAGAILDRLLHRAEILVIQGESYRLKERAQRAAAAKRE
jgi:DNA replication protein DnaC